MGTKSNGPSMLILTDLGENTSPGSDGLKTPFTNDKPGKPLPMNPLQLPSLDMRAKLLLSAMDCFGVLLALP